MVAKSWASLKNARARRLLAGQEAREAEAGDDGGNSGCLPTKEYAGRKKEQPRWHEPVCSGCDVADVQEVTRPQESMSCMSFTTGPCMSVQKLDLAFAVACPRLVQVLPGPVAGNRFLHTGVASKSGRALARAQHWAVVCLLARAFLRRPSRQRT
eukprot:s7248_g1.t1